MIVLVVKTVKSDSFMFLYKQAVQRIHDEYI